MVDWGLGGADLGRTAARGTGTIRAGRARPALRGGDGLCTPRPGSPQEGVDRREEGLGRLEVREVTDSFEEQETSVGDRGGPLPPARDGKDVGGPEDDERRRRDTVQRGPPVPLAEGGHGEPVDAGDLVAARLRGAGAEVTSASIRRGGVAEEGAKPEDVVGPARRRIAGIGE